MELSGGKLRLLLQHCFCKFIAPKKKLIIKAFILELFFIKDFNIDYRKGLQQISTRKYSDFILCLRVDPILKALVKLYRKMKLLRLPLTRYSHVLLLTFFRTSIFKNQRLSQYSIFAYHMLYQKNFQIQGQILGKKSALDQRLSTYKHLVVYYVLT